LKILWAKANKILPVHSGGDIRSITLPGIAASMRLRFSPTTMEHPMPHTRLRCGSSFRGQFAFARKSAGWLAEAWLGLCGSAAAQAPYAVSRFAAARSSSH